MQIVTSVEVFSMPFFFASTATVIARAVAMFAFGLMLAIYIGERELLRGCSLGKLDPCVFLLLLSTALTS